MRSAEKGRISTCLFADEIARLSIEKYREICPRELANSYRQTVLSTILVENRETETAERETAERKTHSLQVISLGVGTKYMKYRYVESDGITLSSKHLSCIRDCHAEILARRGFLLYLFQEMKAFFEYTIQLIQENPNIDLQLVKSFLFEFESNPSTEIFKRDHEGEFKSKNFDQLRLKLRDSIRFHMYTSSSPCGNACIKRWAKGQTISPFLDLPVNEYPVIPHPRLYVTAPQEGQIAVLMKKGSGVEKRIDQQDSSAPNPQIDLLGEVLNNLSPPVSKYHYSAPSYPIQHLPISSSFPCSYPLIDKPSGILMSCSDKITVWNVLGIQGTFLSHLLPSPIYLSSMTIGRKMSIPHVYRGLCCRGQDFHYPAGETTKEGNSTVGEHPSLYTCHHPIMMSTSVKLDEGVIMTSHLPSSSSSLIQKGENTLCEGETQEETQELGKSGDAEVSDKVKLEDVKLGAIFEEPRCLCYVREPNRNFFESLCEVIDGETGLVVNTEEVSESAVCSKRLFIQYISCESLKDRLLSLLNRVEGEEDREYTEMKWGEDVSIEEYCLLKRIGYRQYLHLLDQLTDDHSLSLSSSLHSQAKDLLLSSKYLKGWMRTTSMLRKEGEIENTS